MKNMRSIKNQPSEVYEQNLCRPKKNGVEEYVTYGSRIMPLPNHPHFNIKRRTQSILLLTYLDAMFFLEDFITCTSFHNFGGGHKQNLTFLWGGWCIVTSSCLSTRDVEFLCWTLMVIKEKVILKYTIKWMSLVHIQITV